MILEFIQLTNMALADTRSSHVWFISLNWNDCQCIIRILIWRDYKYKITVSIFLCLCIGLYTCKVTNLAGVSQKDIQVHIIGKYSFWYYDKLNLRCFFFSINNGLLFLIIFCIFVFNLMFSLRSIMLTFLYTLMQYIMDLGMTFF